MIRIRPYDDLSALSVFQALDPHDQIEADLVRGAVTGSLALFADWRAMEGWRVASHIALTGAGTPFAVFALGHTGQSGVANAALLARHHPAFRLPLARLAVMIRHELPGFCAARGIHRVEARSWFNHPTGGLLLRALGFAYEAHLPGFGPTGQEVFTQFAWVAPACALSPFSRSTADVHADPQV